MIIPNVKNNRNYSTRMIAKILKISQIAVVEHLHTLEYVNSLEIRISHNYAIKIMLYI